MSSSKQPKDDDKRKEEEDYYSSDEKSEPPPAYSKLSRTFSRLSFSSEKKAVPPPPAPPAINPETQLPTTFRIGKSFVAPLVTVPEMVHHLTFLACLHKLQEDVRSCPTPADSEGLKDAPEEDQVPEDIKWAAFCARAANRFEEWAISKPVTGLYDKLTAGPVSRTATREELSEILDHTDIDVLMAWHTYMLNPGAFLQDMFREGEHLGKLRGVRAIGTFPLAMICERINLSTYTYSCLPKKKQRLPLVSLHRTLSTVTVRCPRCDRSVKLPLIGVPNDPAGTGGFAMPTMSYKCTQPPCTLEITHEKLQVARFRSDLEDVRTGRMPFMAGLGDNESPYFNSAAGKVMSTAMVAGADYWRNGHSWDIAATAQDWKLDKIREAAVANAITEKLFFPVVQRGMLGMITRGAARKLMGAAMTRMVKCYNGTTSAIVSVDLGPAIMRQAGFVTSMQGLGWLDISRWRNPEDNSRFYFLQKAAARYHAFLDLMHANPKVFLSPTLDIDLGWHTHQLHGVKYARDTQTLVGKFVNHDDAVADVTLKAAYNETASLWADRFHTSYSGCGCAVPAKAERVLAKARRRSTGPAKLLAPSSWGRHAKAAQVAGTLKEISAMSDDAASVENRAAECPSTHNRMRIVSDGTDNKDKYRFVPDAPVGGNHPDPFTAPFDFVPADEKKRKRREEGSGGAGYYDPYWGVAPYTAYGPWGLGNAWVLPMGVGVGVGVGAGAACAVGVGDTSGRCAAAGGAMAACSFSGAMCSSNSGGCAGGGSNCGGSSNCGGGGGGCGGGGGGCGGGGGGS